MLISPQFDTQIKRLQVAAVDELVADGRPRDIVETMEIIQLADHITRTVTLKPVHASRLPRQRLSEYCARYTRDPCISGGRYAGTLPTLADMRDHEASAATAEDGARVPQRALGGLLARKRCRRVCYELLEVLFPG